MIGLLLVAAGGCADARAPAPELGEEPDRVAASEPSPPAPPTPPAEPVSNAPAAPVAPTAPATALRLETKPHRCSEPSTDAGAEPTLRIRRAGTGLRIDLRGFGWYCKPDPVFTGRLEDAVIVLEALPPEPPVARCTCRHDVRVVVRDTPDEVRLVTLVDGDEELARTRIDR
jgi:hypothetical protein